jgi:hypothetical protein
VVGFLLGLCGECVVNLKTAQRAECVQRVIKIITEKTDVTLESILRHPHRVRYWVLLTDSCTSGLSKCGNSSGISSVDCIRVPDGCDGLVMRHLMCPVVPEMDAPSLSNSHNCNDVSSYLKFSAQELVPWETVTDLTLRVSALSDLSTPYDEDDTSAPSSSRTSTMRSTYRRRHLASAKRRRLQCGLDASNLSRSLTEDIHESDSTWMLLGASMIAEQLSSSLTSPFSCISNASHPGLAALDHLRGTTYRFPRVYSAGYLWEVFYPHMLILLKAPALAASEGLSLMGHLGECAAAPTIPTLLLCTTFYVSRANTHTHPHITRTVCRSCDIDIRPRHENSSRAGRVGADQQYRTMQSASTVRTHIGAIRSNQRLDAQPFEREGG